MRQIIEDLFNGKIRPCDQVHVNSEKYLEAIRRLAEAEERLLRVLDDAGKEMLEAYQNAQADAIVERDMANFAYGFELCMELILESLCDRHIITEDRKH